MVKQGIIKALVSSMFKHSDSENIQASSCYLKGLQ